MPMITHDQHWCVRCHFRKLFQHVVHLLIHIHDNMLIFVFTRIIRVLWITISPESVLNSISSGKISEKQTHRMAKGTVTGRSFRVGERVLG